MRLILMVMGLFVGGLAGCANTYHPEYHPVTNTSYSQNVNQPVTVDAYGRPVQVPPVQGPTTRFPPPPQPPQPPPDFPW
jgi:hypothetical protein